MSWNPPSIQEIADRVVGEIEGKISQNAPVLPKAFIRVIGKVFAGVWTLVYKYTGFMFLQIFVAYATMQETTVNGRKIRPLVEWGRLIGVGDPYSAVRAEIVIAVTVKVQSGDLPAGSLLLHEDTGVIYETAFARALNAAEVSVTVRAVSSPNGGDGSGAIGNREEGAPLVFAKTQPNIVRIARVVAVTKPGADAEQAEAYRARIVRRFRNRPQGGAKADYQAWAESVPGILHAYPYKGLPGQVTIYCEATEASSGSVDGFPTAAQLDAVENAVEFDESGVANRRPINAGVKAMPITRTAFAVVVVGLEPDTAANRFALEQGFDEFLRSREPFIVGLSTLPRLDRVTQSSLAGIADSVASARGATVTATTLPALASSLGPGEKARLGTVNYAA